MQAFLEKGFLRSAGPPAFRLRQYTQSKTIVRLNEGIGPQLTS